MSGNRRTQRCPATGVTLIPEVTDSNATDKGNAGEQIGCGYLLSEVTAAYATGKVRKKFIEGTSG